MTAPYKRANNLMRERVVMSLNFPGSGFTAAVAASGTITCDTNANGADGNTVTIGDGISPAVVYEYDKSANGVAGTNVSWAAGTTAASNATALRLLILAQQPSLSVADNLAGVLTITHRWPGTGGNITITKSGNVVSAVTGLSGGLQEVATAITATTTIKLHKALRPMKLEKAQLISPTGLAADAANYYTITLKKGSTVMATWSTLTGQEGALTADTFKDMTLSGTAANLIAATDDVLSLVCTLTGTQTLPAGRLVIHGLYL